MTPLDALLHVLKRQAIHRTASEKIIPNKKLSAHTPSGNLLQLNLGLEKVQQTVSILLSVRTVRTVEEDSFPKVHESECSDWINESELWMKRFKCMTSRLNDIDRKLHQIVGDTILIRKKDTTTADMENSLPSVVQQYSSSENTAKALDEIYKSEIFQKTRILVIQSRERWKKLKNEITSPKGGSKLFTHLRYV